MLKKHVLNELHEMPIKHEKSGICRERSTIGKTTLADLGSSGESRAGSSPVIRTQWREAEPGVLFQESVRRGGKLHAEIAKNKSVRA